MPLCVRLKSYQSMKWPIRAGIGQVEEHGRLEAFAPGRAPEPHDLAQGLRVPRRCDDVADATPLELLVEGTFAPPGDVLRTVVGEHLLGGAVGRDRGAEDLEHQRRRLARIQAEA